MKRPPEPSSHDIGCWKRLVRQARTAVADPTAAMGDLVKATKAARRAIVFGLVSRENICIRLVRVSDRFAGETHRGRRDLAAELQQLADEVDAQVQAALTRPDPPQRRFRADVDG